MSPSAVTSLVGVGTTSVESGGNACRVFFTGIHNVMAFNDIGKCSQANYHSFAVSLGQVSRSTFRIFW
jgi:hypothetical protein